MRGAKTLRLTLFKRDYDVTGHPAVYKTVIVVSVKACRDVSVT
jgi:hypothetical protein